jgi:L-threonylcarbamoyladenylate synthase
VGREEEDDGARRIFFVIFVVQKDCDATELQPAVDWLRAGGIVAFPTDTFYGLAVDPQSRSAVRALFDLKGRGAQAALPFVASERPQVERWCGALSAPNARLADRFWPGPLSLVLDAPSAIVPEALAGGDSLAIRVPAARIARALAAAWGAPLPATSANRSGEPPAASAAALANLERDPRVLVIDGGITPGGLPSTIVDARGASPVRVRDGAIAWGRVLESLQA